MDGGRLKSGVEKTKMIFSGKFATFVSISFAGVTELVDVHDLGSCSLGSGGSNPSSGTIFLK